LPPVPSRRVGGADDRATLGAGFRKDFGPIEPACPDGEHHVDRVDDEADREVVTLRRQIPQLAQPTFGVGVGVEEHICGLPEQPQQQVAVARCLETLGDQLGKQRTPRGAITGSEPAMVSQVQRLCPRHRVRRFGGLLKQREDRRVFTGAVVILPGKPDPEPEGSEGPRVRERQGTPRPPIQQGR